MDHETSKAAFEEGQEAAPDAAWPSIEFLRRAVAQAHPNSLRLALYQGTGDEELARMTLEPRPVWGGTYFQLTLGDDDLGVALPFRVFLVRVRAVNEDDEVGVLLDGSRIA